MINMAVQRVGSGTGYDDAEFIGLSTDTKPTDCDPKSTFLELDTGNVYMFDGDETWYQL